MQVLRARVHAIAVAGRLKVSAPRATALPHAVCTGTVLALLAEPSQTRDPACPPPPAPPSLPPSPAMRRSQPIPPPAKPP